MTQPLFISFEGGEGSGKSTQIKHLAANFAKTGVEAIITREPGGCPGAEEVRALVLSGDVDRWSAFSEALLVTAGRLEHKNRVIEPALKKGHMVLTDRFYDSTVVYQGIAMGAGADKILELQRLALGDFKPDLTLLLDIPVEKGLARAVQRESDVAQNGHRVKEDRHERMGMDYHHKIRAAYLELAKSDPQRFVIIDADKDPDALADDIWSVVQERLDKVTEERQG